MPNNCVCWAMKCIPHHDHNQDSRLLRTSGTQVLKSFPVIFPNKTLKNLCFPANSPGWNKTFYESTNKLLKSRHRLSGDEEFLRYAKAPGSPNSGSLTFSSVDFSMFPGATARAKQNVLHRWSNFRVSKMVLLGAGTKDKVEEAVGVQTQPCKRSSPSAVSDYLLRQGLGLINNRFCLWNLLRD